MTSRFYTLLFLGLFAFLAVAPVSAEIIPIVNGDFESPVIDPAVHIYGQIYDPAEYYLMVPWMIQEGALTNPTMLDAALPGSGYGIDMTGHGNQCAYMWCGLDPSLKPFWYQDLASTFEAGKEYTLSMDAAMARGAAVEGQILEMRLGYWPETPDTTAGPTIIAQKNIAYDQITESWGSYAISSSAVTGDAVGKNIVVYITQGAPLVPSTQQYYVDNVQLSAIAVPEPGTIAILASGILGLAAFVWRKKS